MFVFVGMPLVMTMVLIFVLIKIIKNIKFSWWLKFLIFLVCFLLVAVTVQAVLKRRYSSGHSRINSVVPSERVVDRSSDGKY